MQPLDKSSLSLQFEHLSVDVDFFPKAISLQDRMKINSTLDATFGENKSARCIRKIIKDFLGLTFNVSDGFRILIERCNDLFNKSNQEKSLDVNAAVILQEISDTEFFSHSVILPQFEQLAKSHYVVLRMFNPEEEIIGTKVSEIAKELSGRPIMTLIVRINTLEHKKLNKVFISLAPRATVILNSCYKDYFIKNYHLAHEIADAVHSRPVFAYTGKCSEYFFTPCSSGYGMVAFNEDRTQIAKIFTRYGENVIESRPFSPEDVRIEHIKYALLQNKVLAATSGDPIAQNMLGVACEKRKGIFSSDENAAKRYTEAAERGYAPAQYNLAICYIKGIGVPQSYENAFSALLEAAEQGHGFSQYYLSIFYSKGSGVSKSDEKATEWLLEAAKQGNRFALHNLGLRYSKGKGVPESYEKAADCFRKAADHGLACSQCNLGSCYHSGSGVDQSYKDALMWFQEAAKQGDAFAQYNLGIYCQRGLGGLTRSSQNAIDWMKKSAEQGNEYAMIYLKEPALRIDTLTVITSTSELDGFVVDDEDKR